MKTAVNISTKRLLYAETVQSIHSNISPQLYKRFSDLSRHTFVARKSDPRLENKIILGEKDLVLKTKLKDTTVWEAEVDLDSFGEISNIDPTIT